MVKASSRYSQSKRLFIAQNKEEEHNM